jgi:hypothetical protein
MTIGDVLAVVAGIGSACVAAWTALVASALLFSRHAQRGQTALEAHPWRTVFSGFVIAIIGIVGSIALMNLPNGLVKLLGWVLLLAMLSLGALGGGAVAKLMAQRVQQSETRLSHFGALLRGAAIPVVSSLLPFVGWFVFLPLGLSAALGAGWSSLRTAKQRAVQPQFPVSEMHASTHIAPQI